MHSVRIHLSDRIFTSAYKEHNKKIIFFVFGRMLWYGTKFSRYICFPIPPWHYYEVKYVMRTKKNYIPARHLFSFADITNTLLLLLHGLDATTIFFSSIFEMKIKAKTDFMYIFQCHRYVVIKCTFEEWKELFSKSKKKLVRWERWNQNHVIC